MLAVTSLLLHALGAAAVLALVARSDERHPMAPTAAPATFDVLVEIAPEDVSEVNREATPEPASGAESSRARPPSSASHTRSERVTAVPSSGDAPPQSSQSGAGEEWSFLPGGPPPSDSESLDDDLAPAIRKGVAATVRDALRESAARDAHRFVPGYGDHEIGLGLTPGGELVTMLEAVARRSLLPDESHAELRFDVDEKGVVYAAEVVNAPSAWLGGCPFGC